MDDSRKQVSSHLVGAEEMPEAGTLEPRGDVLGDGVFIGDDQIGKHGHADHQDQQNQAQHGGFALPVPPPDLLGLGILFALFDFLLLNTHGCFPPCQDLYSAWMRGSI